MNISIEIVGVIAAILTTSSFVPQVYKTWKSKNVDGISLTMFLALFIGILFWLIYGILIDSFSIILANIVSGLLVGALVVLRIIYKE